MYARDHQTFGKQGGKIFLFFGRFSLKVFRCLNCCANPRSARSFGKKSQRKFCGQISTQDERENLFLWCFFPFKIVKTACDRIQLNGCEIYWGDFVLRSTSLDDFGIIFKMGTSKGRRGTMPGLQLSKKGFLSTSPKNTNMFIFTLPCCRKRRNYTPLSSLWCNYGCTLAPFSPTLMVQSFSTATEEIGSFSLPLTPQVFPS